MPSLIQSNLLDQLRAQDPELIVTWDQVRNVASSLRGRLASPSRRQRPETTLESFLYSCSALFGPSNLTRVLQKLRQRTDNLGWTHIEYQQMYSPAVELESMQVRLEVYGSKLVGHIAADGTLTEVQSSCWPELEVETTPRLTPEGLRERLIQLAEQAPGFRALQQQMFEQKEESFPIMQRPRLVVYPWQGGFRLAWTTYAYGAVEVKDPTGKPTGARRIELGQVFVDAMTGEQFLFAPTRMHMETPDTGTGSAVTPLGGAYTSRNLNIVRVDTSSTYHLRDTPHDRDDITYDPAADPKWASTSNIVAALKAGTLPVSEDTDGDKTWNRLPTDTTDAQRTLSQQPEVDVHYWCARLYEWHNALSGSRAGWDDNQFPDPPVPPQPVRVLAHGWDTHAWPVPTSRSVNAFFDMGLSVGAKGDPSRWFAFLAFFDGDPTATCTSPNDSAFDYVGGSAGVVGHEYQHAITNFSFMDGAGNPGLNGTGWDWFSAVHEGLSDVVGCMFAENWFPGLDVSEAGLCIRNLAFPRDPTSWANRPGTPPCGLSNHNKDHFDDRDLDGGFLYDRGTILAHCAYLMGQGGVHQRTARTPALIPVYSIGRETVGGIDVLKAARIWNRAVTYYFSTFGALSGVPTDDATTFRTIRDGCVSSAADIYGVGSLEHRTTILAFYAVGLQPPGTPYGADVTFMRWGWNWRISRPYVGLSSPDWSSVDLFINNGGLSQWNALINILDNSGNPTQFENTVFCRVRNVGDQAAQNVQVQLQYAKAGTGVTTWQSVTDKNGNIQTLSLGTLAAGQSNFPDSAQNTPPSSGSVKWYIPPLAPGETVDHFCLRATVTSVNDVNIYNNDVQSNIAYAPYTPEGGFHFTFMAGNPTREEIPVDLHLEASLPHGWRAHIVEPTHGMRLRPGEERPLQVVVDMLPGADKRFEPPFDGELQGRVFGALSGAVTGNLMGTTWDGEQLRGTLAAHLEEVGMLVGAFEGRLNVHTGEVKGRMTAAFDCAGMEHSGRICVGIEACLRPLRRVNISQYINGEPIGGISIQVQVPMPEGACAQELPPTETRVVPGRVPEPQPGTATRAAPQKALTGKVVRLIYDCFGDFTGFVLALCDREQAFHSRERAVEHVVRTACNERALVTIIPDEHDTARISRIEVQC